MPRNRETRRAQNAEYRKNNRDKIRAKNAEYYASNREQILVQKSTYWVNNREKLIAKHMEWHIHNRDKIRDRRAEYYANNREKLLAQKVEYHTRIYQHRGKGVHLARIADWHEFFNSLASDAERCIAAHVLMVLANVDTTAGKIVNDPAFDYNHLAHHFD
jgi:hypothetical protein